MATSTADPAPLARAAVRRYYPRQEPSAVVPHAGICAGGGRPRPSLPPPLVAAPGRSLHRPRPLAAPRRRMHRPCPIGRDPKGSPCRCPADRPWTKPTAPRHPRLIDGFGLRHHDGALSARRRPRNARRPRGCARSWLRGATRGEDVAEVERLRLLQLRVTA